MWRRYFDIPLLIVLSLTFFGLVLSIKKGASEAGFVFLWLLLFTLILLSVVHYDIVILISVRLIEAYIERKQRLLDQKRRVAAIAEERRQRILADPTNQTIQRLQERSTPDLMHSLDPVEFERFVLDYFRLIGFYAEETKRSGDGGIDGHLRLGNFVYFLQCKRYDKRTKVGEPELRDLLGAVTKASAKGGIFVTTASYSNKALTFASGTVLELIDGEELANRIKALVLIDPTDCGGNSTLQAVKVS